MVSPTINLTRFTKYIVASTMELESTFTLQIVLGAIQIVYSVIKSIVHHYKQYNKV